MRKTTKKVGGVFLFIYLDNNASIKGNKAYKSYINDQ